MRNPGHLLLRSTLRGFRAATVVALIPAGLLLTGGSAFATVTTTAQADTNAESFGVLGPVGLVAVALGIVGMTLGVLRQRRKTRAALALTDAAPLATTTDALPKPEIAGRTAPAAQPEISARPTPMPGAVLAEPNRPGRSASVPGTAQTPGRTAPTPGALSAEPNRLGRTAPMPGAAAQHPGLPDPEVPGPVTAMAEAVLAKPAEPEVPGPVTAMAEAVLAEPDATPTRPFLAPGSHA
ncbi:hypothetical protein [Amycolatopsis melonis]|uniref:hypothetical protein n=1 Tax=Amycolatopsis melonis TaxID=3156488 RepID=UPI003D6D26E7